MHKAEKSRKNVKQRIFQARVWIEKVSKYSEIDAPALNLISKSTHNIFNI